MTTRVPGVNRDAALCAKEIGGNSTKQKREKRKKEREKGLSLSNVGEGKERPASITVTTVLVPHCCAPVVIPSAGQPIPPDSPMICRG